MITECFFVETFFFLANNKYNNNAWTKWEGYFMGLWRVSVHLLSRACTKGRVLPVSRLSHQKTVIKKIGAIDTATFKSYYQHYVSISLLNKRKSVFLNKSVKVLQLWLVWRLTGTFLFNYSEFGDSLVSPCGSEGSFIIMVRLNILYNGFDTVCHYWCYSSRDKIGWLC